MQTFPTLRQRQLSQASCHLAPGWREGRTCSLDLHLSACRLFCNTTHPSTRPGGLARDPGTQPRGTRMTSHSSLRKNQESGARGEVGVWLGGTPQARPRMRPHRHSLGWAGSSGAAHPGLSRETAASPDTSQGGFPSHTWGRNGSGPLSCWVAQWLCPLHYHPPPSPAGN